MRPAIPNTGAHNRIRTDDLFLTKEVLYLLSYVSACQHPPYPPDAPRIRATARRDSTRDLERVAGIEPASSAWKAEVLPLNYTRHAHLPARRRPAVPERTHRHDLRPPTDRVAPRRAAPRLRFDHPTGARFGRPVGPGLGSGGWPAPDSFIIWWRGKDSNLRRLSRQIYSLIPLTAREPLQTNTIQPPAPGFADAARRPSIHPILRDCSRYSSPWCRHKELNPGPSHYK